MKSFWKAVLLCMPILVLEACIGVPVAQTNKDRDYHEFLKRVDIVAETGNVVTIVSKESVQKQAGGQLSSTREFSYEPLSDYLSETIGKRFLALGIEAKSFKRSGLDLTDDQFQKEVAAYVPTQVLMIQLKEGTVSQNNQLVPRH